ncbi:RICIN domain-containing protein [Actinomycetes bacterium KLBMP 9797]
MSITSKLLTVGLAVVAALATASPARADGTYYVANKNSDLCLAVGDSSQANGAAVVQWTCESEATSDKRWIWTEVDVDNGAKVYRLENVHSQRCLAIGAGSTANGAEAIQWTCRTSDEQRWKWDSAGRLRNMKSGLCLAIPGASKAPGVQAVQWTCKDTGTNPEQAWDI